MSAGAKGKRNALPHSRIMIHQPLAGMEGTATEILIHAEEFIRMKKQLNQIYQKHTGQTLERLQEDTDRDRFMSPEEARDYGLIDNVVDREPPIPAQSQSGSRRSIGRPALGQALRRIGLVGFGEPERGELAGRDPAEARARRAGSAAGSSVVQS